MKTLISTFLILGSVSSFAGTKLRSKTLRSLVCTATLSDVEDSIEFENMNLSTADCVKNAKISLENSIRNEVINQAVIMETSLRYDVKDIEISSDVQLKKTINFNSDGEMVTKWNSFDVQVNVEDNRDFESILDGIFSDYDSVDIGQGDLGYDSPESPVTLAEIEEEFEEIQSDTECRFYSDFDTDSVIYEIKDRSYKLYKILKNNKDKIKYAALLSYDDGPSEYCSLWYFKIVLKSGKVLYIDVDYTT